MSRNFAAYYRDCGISVIPLRPRDKRPALHEWKTYQKRLPTEDELEGWFGQGDANVGVVCGQVSGGLVVADFDNTLALRSFLDIVPELEEGTVRVTTARGGHIWLLTTEPVRPFRVEEFGLDIKGEGSYVLAPPSIHPSGRQYEFANESAEIMGVVNFSAWLQDALARLGVGWTPPEAGDNGNKPRLDLAAALAGLEDGNRNETFARIAGRLHRGGLAPDDIFALLLPHAKQVAFDVDELEREVKGICQRYAPSASTATTHFHPIPIAELLEAAPAEVSWRWRDYIPLGGFSCMSGRSKVGKTTLAYHIAQAVSKGLPLLGRETTQGPVTIIATEEREEDVALRCRELGIDEAVTVHIGPLRSEAALEEIDGWCRLERPALIIIDTLFRFWNVQDAGDPMQVADALNPYLALARETGTSFLFLSQLRKSEGREGVDILGSTELLAQMDVGLALRRRSEGQANERVLEAFSRYACTPRELVIRLSDAGYEALGDRAELRRREQHEKVREALDGDYRGIEELSERVGLGVRKTATVLNLLAADGIADRIGRGVRGDPHLWRIHVCCPP